MLAGSSQHTDCACANTYIQRANSLGIHDLAARDQCVEALHFLASTPAAATRPALNVRESELTVDRHPAPDASSNLAVEVQQGMRQNVHTGQPLIGRHPLFRAMTAATQARHEDHTHRGDASEVTGVMSRAAVEPRIGIAVPRRNTLNRFDQKRRRRDSCNEPDRFAPPLELAAVDQTGSFGDDHIGDPLQSGGIAVAHFEHDVHRTGNHVACVRPDDDLPDGSDDWRSCLATDALDQQNDLRGYRRMPTIPDTTPTCADWLDNCGPCSMWSSRYAATDPGARASRCGSSGLPPIEAIA
jgi:hypothetical protein